MRRRYPDEQFQEGTFGHWFFGVWSHAFFRLLGANVLFLLACVPIITIPAAICGLHGVVQNFYRKLYVNTVFQTFKNEFLSNFAAKTVLFYAIAMIPVLVLLLFIHSNTTPLVLTGCAFLFLFALVILTWFVPQLTMLNLKPLHALKNAAIFTCMETGKNFLLMAVHAVGLSIMTFMLPLSVFFLLLLPVLHVVIVTYIVVPTLAKYLVKNNVQQKPNVN